MHDHDRGFAELQYVVPNRISYQGSASPEATALAQTEFAFVTSSTLILGFIMNLVIARITPFKNIFLRLVIVCSLRVCYL